MSSVPDQRESYIRLLSEMTGDAFESEVVTALQQTMPAFQRIPRKGGDGGLDGLCDGHETAYCCYGPETARMPGHTDAKHRKRLVDKVVEKFTDDLMRIFEVQPNGKNSFAPRPNIQLEGVLGTPPSTKIKTIRLVSSWFEDARIIGGIKKALIRIQKASTCRFADAECQFVVWGPKDVAGHVRITQQTMLRCEHPALLAAVDAARAAAVTHVLDDVDDFDSKFDDLKRRIPAQAASIDELRRSFKLAWSTSIKLEERLATQLPTVHRSYEAARSAAAEDARLASMNTGTAPPKIIDESRQRLRERMGQLVSGGLPADLSEELARAETGRLIGECPLDWRNGDGK